MDQMSKASAERDEYNEEGRKQTSVALEAMITNKAPLGTSFGDGF